MDLNEKLIQQLNDYLIQKKKRETKAFALKVWREYINRSKWNKVIFFELVCWVLIELGAMYSNLILDTTTPSIGNFSLLIVGCVTLLILFILSIRECLTRIPLAVEETMENWKQGMSEYQALKNPQLTARDIETLSYLKNLSEVEQNTVASTLKKGALGEITPLFEEITKLHHAQQTGLTLKSDDFAKARKLLIQNIEEQKLLAQRLEQQAQEQARQQQQKAEEDKQKAVCLANIKQTEETIQQWLTTYCHYEEAEIIKASVLSEKARQMSLKDLEQHQNNLLNIKEQLNEKLKQSIGLTHED